MISRISSIIASHATAIPSDEGRVFALYRRVVLPVRPAFQKDSYSDFSRDRFPKLAEAAPAAKKQDLASNSSLHGHGVTLYAASMQKVDSKRDLYRMIIRA